MGAYDFNGTSYSSAYDRAGISAVTWYGNSRRGSQVQYVTPNFGGFTLRAGYTAKGDNEVGSASTNAGTYAGYNATLGAAKAQYSFPRQVLSRPGRDPGPRRFRHLELDRLNGSQTLADFA